MGPKLGLPPLSGYKRSDTSLICTRSHGRTLNWHFNVCFQCYLQQVQLKTKSISSKNLDFLCSNECIKFFNMSLVRRRPTRLARNSHSSLWAFRVLPFFSHFSGNFTTIVFYKIDCNSAEFHFQFRFVLEQCVQMHFAMF